MRGPSSLSPSLRRTVDTAWHGVLAHGLKGPAFPTRIAEFFADILLTPAEAVRIRLVSDRHYATNMLTGFQRMAAEGGLQELYAGFVPILAKQIPCEPARLRPSGAEPSVASGVSWGRLGPRGNFTRKRNLVRGGDAVADQL